MSVGARRLPVVHTTAQQVSQVRVLARNSLVETIPRDPVSLAIVTPTSSGMACQWQRAQTGDVNLRILPDVPAAFTVTGTAAEVFGQLFRQFFIVG